MALRGGHVHYIPKGAERFIAFQTDRDFKLTLNKEELRWGKPAISGAVLYGLAKPGEGEAVFLEIPGGEDRLIERIREFAPLFGIEVLGPSPL